MESTIVNSAIEIIKGILPSDSRLLVLSLTGSRAFGWASSNMDYDVHGVYYASNYWDWVHLGKSRFDINLHELSHIVTDLKYQHFEVMMNLSNPVYVDPDFDYDGMYRLLRPVSVLYKRHDVKNEISKFRNDRCPRTALHAFRQMMVCLNFINTGKFVLDVFRLKDQYGITVLESLRDAYLRYTQFDYDKTINELESLYSVFESTVSKIDDTRVDEKDIYKWYFDVLSRYNIPCNGYKSR